MRVLVAGGAGFIGSALARRLVLERGRAVLVADEGPTSRAEGVHTQEGVRRRSAPASHRVISA